MRALMPTAAALFILTGCAAETQLRPSPGAQVLQSDANAAKAATDGIVLVADGTAWKGTPKNLELSLTPVFIQLENRGQRPLRIKYGVFSLVGTQSRFRYAALAPLSLGDTVISGQEGTGGSGAALGFSSGWGYGRYRPFGGFGVGSYMGPYYPDPYYAGYQCREPLPTRDMLQKALPEGTLEPGGRMSGFLYFQGVGSREGQVVLQARLVDAESGEPLGTLDIPFQVRKG
ncbi:hypothetical protein [Myxococcus xanthus]|uniref:hypothetical protein n=1 Tax=Myxococcus xanthus TaxID=34 RepID=UPI00112E198A|nr:hypothetical protein [Myxococcus xanthus]QDF00668.1 hypothetical protein BHS05_35260 [Myxococcus xanthus]